MKKKTILRIVLAVLAAALLGGCLYLNSLLPIITGYAAKNLASGVFVSGREPADVEALDLHFSFIKFTRNKVDFENKTVTSRFLWGKSVAAFRDGYGVTLLRGKKAPSSRRRSTPFPPRPKARTAWSPGIPPSRRGSRRLRRPWSMTTPTTGHPSPSSSCTRARSWPNGTAKACRPVRGF